MQPIADRAEVAIDFPDKFYMGGFGRDCAFEASADADGVETEYLIGTPLLADYLEEALAALGYSIADYEKSARER